MDQEKNEEDRKMYIIPEIVMRTESRGWEEKEEDDDEECPERIGG